MDIIGQFLSNVSNAGSFNVEVASIKEFTTKCSIRFIFMEIGSPTPKFIMYLPDYLPVLEEANSQGIASIIFMPQNSYCKQITFNTDNQQLINIWTNFAMNSKMILEEMIKLTNGADIDYEEPMTVLIPGRTQPDVFTVHLKNDEISFKEITTGEVLLKKIITTRTHFIMSTINERPHIKIQESTKDETYVLEIPNFSSIMMWRLALVVSQHNVEEREKSKLNDISLSGPVDVLPEIEKTNDTPISRDVRHTESIENMEYEAMELEEKLKRELKNYKRTFPVCSPEPEPKQEDLLDPSKYQRETLHPLPEPIKSDKNSFTKNDFKKLIINRLKTPSTNCTRLLPQYVHPIDIFQDIDFQPNSLKSFKNVYSNSHSTDRFVLLCSVLTNGFIGKSLSKFFDVATLPDESLGREAARIVTTLELGVLDCLLKKSAEDYSETSIARDEALLKHLKSIGGAVENPGEFPDPLPFGFPHRPLASLAPWFLETVYAHKQGCLDLRRSVLRLCRILYSFLRHHLSPPKGRVLSFMREAGDRAGALRLSSSLRGSERGEEDSVVTFWAESYREGRLFSNFAAMMQQRETIAKYYEECSLVRSGKAANEVGAYLQAFEGLGLSSGFEWGREGEDRSLGVSSLISKVLAMRK